VHKEKAETKKSRGREKKKQYTKPKAKRLGTVRGVTAAGASGDFLC
jgi:hypothetical protein